MVRGVDRVSQSNLSVASSAEDVSRSPRRAGHEASSLTGSSSDQVPESCLFIKLMGSFFSWIGGKLSRVRDACFSCFCGAESSRNSSASTQTEEEINSPVDDKKSEKEKDPTLEPDAETEPSKDATRSSASEKEESDSSTSEFEEDPEIDQSLNPDSEFERPPVVESGVSFSGLLASVGEKKSSISDSKASAQVEESPLSQEEALKEASVRLREALQKITTPDEHALAYLESRKGELERLIHNREGLVSIGRPSGEASLRDVVEVFDRFVTDLIQEQSTLDSGLLSDATSLSMLFTALNDVLTPGEQLAAFKKELTSCFVAWLGCFGAPAYPFILEKKIAEVTTILEAIIQQTEGIGPAIGSSSNDPLFAYSPADCGGPAELRRRELRKQSILDHLRNIKMEEGEESFRQRVNLIQQNLQVLNANVLRGETLTSMLSHRDPSSSTRELKLAEINGIFCEIGALFGLNRDQSPYIYIAGINDSEHMVRLSRA